MELNDKMLNKLIEYRTDPIKWIKENVKINHTSHGIIPFNLYDFQEKTIKLFLTNHFVLTLKSRQVGMSTLVQSMCLWAALHYSNYQVMILSAGQRQASNFLEKIRQMYDYLPNEYYKISLDTDNKQSLKFENGSKIVAIPATRSSSIGESINLLVIDEAGIIEKVEEVYQGAYPTISRAFNSIKGKPYGIILISTPNGTMGTGKWYYEMYNGAVNKDNKYIPIRVHWSQVPEYDENWYLDQCSQLNWNYRSIASEFELSFVSSGNTYIPGQILDSIAIIEPIQKANDDHFWVWEYPRPEEIYVAGVDVAYGDRKDSSTIQILKASTLEQVAEYDCNCITVDNFAEVVIQICRMYNNCLVNIERNSVGKVLIDKLISKTGNIGINFYRDINQNDLDSSYQTKDLYHTRIGTIVSASSRDILLANMYNVILDKYTEALDTMISEDEEKSNARIKFEAIMLNKTKANNIKKYGIIRSERLLHQLLGFIIDDTGKPQGAKDDLVFAWVHALYCWTKSKAILLRNLTNILNNTVGVDKRKDNQLETLKFIQERTDSRVWKEMDVIEIQKILEEDKLENDKNNKINNDKSANSLMNIYKAFF